MMSRRVPCRVGIVRAGSWADPPAAAHAVEPDQLAPFGAALAAARRWTALFWIS
jgi:hypothetical protein